MVLIALVIQCGHPVSYTHLDVYKRQLNNNVVISTDENNNEIIVTGTGIGFRNHVGGSIDKTRISKIYTLNSSSFKKKFSTLINEIPYECIHLSERIIDLAKSELQKELNQNLILTLADHIHFAIQYHERGEYKPVLMNEEIKHFYLQEYQLGPVSYTHLPKPKLKKDVKISSLICWKMVNLTLKTLPAIFLFQP